MTVLQWTREGNYQYQQLKLNMKQNNLTKRRHHKPKKWERRGYIIEH